MSAGRRQGPLPPGTSTCLLCFVLVISILPQATNMAIGAWSPQGPEAWLDRVMWLCLFIIALAVPPSLGLQRRQYWAICWFWIVSAILLAAYLPALALAAAVPLGWHAAGSAVQAVVAHVALILMLLFSPACWGLYRMVTMRYFQPWTTPDQWETGRDWPLPFRDAVVRTLSPGTFAMIERARDAEGQAEANRARTRAGRAKPSTGIGRNKRR